jgi:phage-related protein
MEELKRSFRPEFLNSVDDIKAAGKQLIEGLWQGIKDTAEWIKNKIKEFCDGIVDGIKEFFGINSPSKLFEDEIGKFLAQGIGLGFSDEMKHVTREMQDAIPTDFSTEVNTALNAAGSDSGTRETEVTIPISVNGQKLTRVVSRIQYNAVTNRSRVLGVSST